MCYDILKEYVKVTKKIDRTQKIYVDKLELKAACAEPGDIVEVMFKVIQKDKRGAPA